MISTARTAPLKGNPFPRSIVAYAVWAYHRFALSLRDVEDLLAERGVVVSYETIRTRCRRFGPQIAARIRRDRPAVADKWTRPVRQFGRSAQAIGGRRRARRPAAARAQSGSGAKQGAGLAASRGLAAMPQPISNRRFMLRFCHRTAAPVDMMKRPISLPYRSFCALYEKWSFSARRSPEITLRDPPGPPTARKLMIRMRGRRAARRSQRWPLARKAAANVASGATRVSGRSPSASARTRADRRAARSFVASMMVGTPPISSVTRRQRKAVEFSGWPASPLPAARLSTANLASREPCTACCAGGLVNAAKWTSCTGDAGATL